MNLRPVPTPKPSQGCPEAVKVCFAGTGGLEKVCPTQEKIDKLNAHTRECVECTLVYNSILNDKRTVFKKDPRIFPQEASSNGAALDGLLSER